MKENLSLVPRVSSLFIRLRNQRMTKKHPGNEVVKIWIINFIALMALKVISTNVLDLRRCVPCIPAVKVAKQGLAMKQKKS